MKKILTNLTCLVRNLTCLCGMLFFAYFLPSSFFSFFSFLRSNISSQTHRLARIDRICPPYPPLMEVGGKKTTPMHTLYRKNSGFAFMGRPVSHELNSSKIVSQAWFSKKKRSLKPQLASASTKSQESEETMTDQSNRNTEFFNFA